MLRICLQITSTVQYLERSFFSITYFGVRFTSAYNSLLFCCLRRNVRLCCHKRTIHGRSRTVCDCLQRMALGRIPAVNKDPAAKCGAAVTNHKARYSLRIENLAQLTCIRRPRQRESRRNIATTFRVQETRIVWLPNGEIFLQISIRFDRIHERDGHTDGHRMTAQAALAQRRAAKTPCLPLELRYCLSQLQRYK